MIDRPDVLAMFTSQHGVASAAQLTRLVHSKTVRRACARGEIDEFAPGVFQLAGATPSFAGRAMAMLLCCGHTSFVSGVTAAALYGLRAMSRQVIHVTVAATARVAVPDWGRVTRTAWIEPGDVIARPDGLRIASPFRMMFRLARDFNDHRFSRAGEDAWHLGLVSPSDAECYLAEIRRSGRGGVKRFEEWLRSVSLRDRPAQSGLELDVLEIIANLGLPEPQRQYPLTLPNGEQIHVDLAWPELRLGIEPGHSWFHGGDLQMRKDYARDRACSELGWHIVRFDETLRHQKPAVSRQIKAIYARRLALQRAGAS